MVHGCKYCLAHVHDSLALPDSPRVVQRELLDCFVRQPAMTLASKSYLRGMKI